MVHTIISIIFFNNIIVFFSTNIISIIKLVIIRFNSHVCVEATSRYDLSDRLDIRNSRFAEVPVRFAEFIDIYGWSYIDAENELGTVLIATGVYDKILKAFELS
jgi:hypothetical protein